MAEKKGTGFDYLDVPEPVIRASHFEEDRAKLHPDLQPYLYIDETFGTQLKHPLHFQIVGVLWKMANDAYEYKSKALAEAIEKKNWHTALFLHERPWRLDMLGQWWAAGMLTKAELGECLTDVWVDAEYPSQHGKTMLVRLFKAAGFITDENVEDIKYDHVDADDIPFKTVEDLFPNPLVTVYRGTGSSDKPGISWTTNIHTAAWFARRFREDDEEHRLAKYPGRGAPKLLRAVVHRKDILAYFSHRNEFEVVADPRKLREVVAIPLPPIGETWDAMGFAPSNGKGSTLAAKYKFADSQK